MESEVKLAAGAMVALALATAVLVVLPYVEVSDIQAPEGLKPYTSSELRGREVYIANGCVYCHSQQPRDRSFGPDAERGWGRASVPGDYVYDKPHLLGSMRTGPDLFNIGARQPSEDWHLGHMYQPRAYVPGSIMPSYPYMFDVKPIAEEGDVVVKLPPGVAPDGQIVVAKPMVIDLVRYLRGLNHTYPVLPAEPRGDSAAPAAKAPAAAAPATAASPAVAS